MPVQILLQATDSDAQSVPLVEGRVIGLCLDQSRKIESEMPDGISPREEIPETLPSLPLAGMAQDA